MFVESAGLESTPSAREGASHACHDRVTVRLGLGTGHRPRPDVPCSNGPRTRALARHLAAEPGLEPSPRRPRAGARPAHDRGLGAFLPDPRPSWDRLRAERGLPPALTPEQQAALTAALHRPPREAGLATATWTGKAVVQFVRQQFGLVLSATS